MKKQILTAVLGSAFLVGGGQALADGGGKDWISIEDAIEKARSLGYTEIREIEADDENWEGQGKKADGKDYEFRLNGKTGEVEKDEED